jgi:hypothetical protein
MNLAAQEVSTRCSLECDFITTSCSGRWFIHIRFIFCKILILAEAHNIDMKLEERCFKPTEPRFC